MFFASPVSHVLELSQVGVIEVLGIAESQIGYWIDEQAFGLPLSYSLLQQTYHVHTVEVFWIVTSRDESLDVMDEVMNSQRFLSVSEKIKVRGINEGFKLLKSSIARERETVDVSILFVLI